MSRVALRVALLAILAAVAATGVLAGLSRLGLGVGWGAGHAAVHGPLLVIGLFAVIVAHERALALRTPAAVVVPLAFVATAVALLLQSPVAVWLAVAATAGMVAANLVAVRRRPTLVSWLVLGGSTLLLIGTLRWASGRPPAYAAPAWMGFFVLTIAGERARLLRRGGSVPGSRLLAVLAVALVVLLGARAFDVRGVAPLAGLSLVGLAIWQMRYDVARSARDPGLPRYRAYGVGAAALWLLAGGLLLALLDPGPGGPIFDAVLHATFVGYLLSTAFVHGPDALAGTTGVTAALSPWFYLPLALLHASLVMRLAGDLAGDLVWRRTGAAGNGLAIALFAAVMAAAVARGPRSRS